MVGTKKTLIRQPDLLLWILGALVVLSLAGFGTYYYYDRYVHANETVLDHQARQVEDMVKQNPQNPDLRVGAADFYLQTGLIDQAIAQAQEALKIKPDYPGALMILGRAYKQKGDLDAALKNYNRFIELQKDSPMAGLNKNLEAIYYEVGMIYSGQAKYPESADALKKALAIDSTDADAHYTLGMVYQQQKDHANAVKELEQALRFDPMYGPPYQALAVSYTALGKTQEAAYAQAMVALTQGQYADAAAQLEAILKQSPNLTQAYFGLGVAYDKLGKVDESLAALQKFVKANPDDIAGQDALARVAKESKP
jgi:protein O-GlcNAc transferase